MTKIGLSEDCKGVDFNDDEFMGSENYFQEVFQRVSKPVENANVKNKLDEEELGSTLPQAFHLQPEDYKSNQDYVSSFVREIRKLHKSDARNEVRRKESLGFSFKTENLQARAFNTPLVTKDNEWHTGKSYYLRAMVPILREAYSAKLHGTRRPQYTRIENSETWLRDSHVIGILSASPLPPVPPVTICEQYNDLRVDLDQNYVYTYVFKAIHPTTMMVDVSDAEDQIEVLKNQEYERQYWQ